MNHYYYWSQILYQVYLILIVHYNVIYKDKCTFFIYDRKEVLCGLIEEPYDNYVHTCDKYGGPVHPSISECYDSDDDCKVS